MANLLISNFPNDKADTFAKIQQKYFGQQIAQSDSVTLNYEEFRTICNDCHEYGRLRERALKNSSLGFK